MTSDTIPEPARQLAWDALVNINPDLSGAAIYYHVWMNGYLAGQLDEIKSRDGRLTRKEAPDGV